MCDVTFYYSQIFYNFFTKCIYSPNNVYNNGGDVAVSGGSCADSDFAEAIVSTIVTDDQGTNENERVNVNVAIPNVKDAIPNVDDATYS